MVAQKAAAEERRERESRYMKEELYKKWKQSKGIVSKIFHSAYWKQILFNLHEILWLIYSIRKKEVELSKFYSE